MQFYEYTVIPAPARGEKVRGARTGAERFSYALLTEMNRMAANGWEYVRAETLPCEERSGLTSRTTVYHNVLVFRRAITPAPAQHRPFTASHDAPPAARPASAAAAPRPSGAAGVPPAGADANATGAARGAPVAAVVPASPGPTAGAGAAAEGTNHAGVAFPAGGQGAQPLRATSAPSDPIASPAEDWPDGAEDDAAHAAAQQAARVDDYDEPGFDPQPADATAPPAFTRRPPLSAARDDEPRGVFSGAMPGSRLGPAER